MSYGLMSEIPQPFDQQVIRHSSPRPHRHSHIALSMAETFLAAATGTAGDTAVKVTLSG